MSTSYDPSFCRSVFNAIKTLFILSFMPLICLEILPIS